MRRLKFVILGIGIVIELTAAIFTGMAIKSESNPLAGIVLLIIGISFLIIGITIKSNRTKQGEPDK